MQRYGNLPSNPLSPCGRGLGRGELRLFLSSLILSGVVACTTTSPEKVASRSQIPQIPQQAQLDSVASVTVPADLSASNIKNNYAIPEAEATEQPSSLAPPGSNLQKIQAQNQPATAQAATFSGSSLQLNMPFATAWNKVGRALPAAGYQVMEKYSYSGTYYILDKAGTGGVVKRDTQIYQVHLQKNGDATAVSLLNDKNQSADSAISGRILGALKNKL